MPWRGEVIKRLSRKETPYNHGLNTPRSRIKLEGVEGLPKLAISARPTSGSDEDFLNPKEVSALVIICSNLGSITDRPK